MGLPYKCGEFVVLQCDQNSSNRVQQLHIHEPSRMPSTTIMINYLRKHMKYTILISFAILTDTCSLEDLSNLHKCSTTLTAIIAAGTPKINIQITGKDFNKGFT